MMLSLQLFRFAHFIGLGMLLGGFMTAFLLTRRDKNDGLSDNGSFVASHLVAAPGLVLLILTGLAQASMANFAQFRAPYMHSKLLLVVLVLFLLGLDIKAQGNLRRALQGPDEDKVRLRSLKLRRKVDFWGLIATMLIILIMQTR